MLSWLIVFLCGYIGYFLENSVLSLFPLYISIQNAYQVYKVFASPDAPLFNLQNLVYSIPVMSRTNSESAQVGSRLRIKTLR